MRALPLRCARRHFALMSPLLQEAQPHRHSEEPVQCDQRRGGVSRRPCGSFAPTPTPTTLTSRSATVLRRAERARLRTSVRVALLFAPTSMPGKVAQSQCHHGEMRQARRQRASIPAPSEVLFTLPSLPEEVVGMVRLTTLNLYDNQLTSLPEGVGGPGIAEPPLQPLRPDADPSSRGVARSELTVHHRTVRRAGRVPQSGSRQ